MGDHRDNDAYRWSRIDAQSANDDAVAQENEKARRSFLVSDRRERLWLWCLGLEHEPRVESEFDSIRHAMEDGFR